MRLSRLADESKRATAFMQSTAGRSVLLTRRKADHVLFCREGRLSTGAKQSDVVTPRMCNKRLMLLM